MTKVFAAGKLPGSSPVQVVASIYEGGNDDPLYNPYGNFHRLYFDSRLDYLNIVGQHDVGLYLAFQPVNTVSSGKKGKSASDILRSDATVHVAWYHGQNYRPAIALYDLNTRRAVAGNQFVQVVNATSFRMIFAMVDSVAVYVMERYFVRSADLPQMWLNLRIFAFNKPAA
jgi:hypothetical protein